MSRRARSDDAYVSFVASRRRRLLATAYLLCGDWHRAEDLVQTTLTKLYIAWPRVLRRGSEDAYVRTALVRAAIDSSRRAWNRERVVDELPDRPTVEPGGVEDRDELVVAMEALPPRQRATLVLRYWLDLSVEDTATELGVSTGTVKSQTAKALDSLRHRLAAGTSTEWGGKHV